MRSNLKNGKLIPPVSHAAAAARHGALVGETALILQHIADGTRRERFATEGEYNAWRDSARRAFRTLRAEQRQLSEWLAFQNNDLFRRAYQLLKTLQEEEVPFGDSEQKLIRQLDTHFGVQQQVKGKRT
jgi:hypothetical protein